MTITGLTVRVRVFIAQSLQIRNVAAIATSSTSASVTVITTGQRATTD